MICAAPAPSLLEYYRATYRPMRLVGKSPRTLIAYETALGQWQRFSAKTPIDLIDARMLAEFQAKLLQTVAAASVNCYCRHLLAILRYYAEEDGLLRAPRWRKLKEPKRVPLALTVEEFSRVLAAADDWPGCIGGVAAGPWWKALLLVAWDTGLRFSALMELRAVDFRGDGVYCQPETQKDAEGQWFTLPPDTVAAVQAVQRRGARLFPCHVQAQTIGRWFRIILDHAGIYAPKGSGCRFHRIRRSKASYTKAAGGDATRELGHSQPSVTERYYDPRICGRTGGVTMPRPIS